MDFEFPPDALMLRDMLRRFVQKDARPLEMKYFNTGRLEPEERARLRSAIEQMGLWGATVPEKFGGGALDAVTSCLIEEELGGTFVPIDLGEVTPLLYECTAEQTVRYLEPALAGKRHAILAAREPGGLRPESWSTVASPEIEAFVLRGRKSLAHLPAAEDFFIVLAQVPEGVTAFLIDADHQGARVEIPSRGSSGDGLAALSLEDCRVGKEAVLGQPGQAMAAAGQGGPLAWIRSGARYVGMVERLKSMAAEHAHDWMSHGGPLSLRPAVQRMLAEMSAEVESARWLVYHAAWLSDRGDSVRVAAAQVRLATGEMLQRAIDRVTLIYGGPGPSTEVLPHRLARSAVPSETLELALEYARAVLAAEVLAPDRER